MKQVCLDPQNIMSTLENINLLVSIVKNDYERVCQQVGRGGFDFVAFEHFVATNQLSGYLCSVLVSSPAGELFPAQALDHLKSSYLRQRKRNRELLVELKQLASAFSAAGQEFILLKGLYLAQRFYGDVDRRSLWDIDILVRKETLQDAQTLLADCGYARKSHIFLHENLSCYFTHAFDFAKKGASLDLHWALSSHPSFHLDYATIWARKQPFYIEDSCFFILPDEYEIVFNLLASLKDLERGALRLRSLVDLYMILKGIGGSLDWNQFFVNRKRENVSKICVTVLSLLLDAFRCQAEFPDLARLVEHERKSLRLEDRQTLAKLLEPSPFGIRNKLWAARLYETTRLSFLLWWMISLPFRLSVYKPGKVSRFKSNMLRYFLKTAGPTASPAETPGRPVHTPSSRLNQIGHENGCDKV